VENESTHDFHQFLSTKMNYAANAKLVSAFIGIVKVQFFKNWLSLEITSEDKKATDLLLWALRECLNVIWNKNFCHSSQSELGNDTGVIYYKLTNYSLMKFHTCKLVHIKVN